MAEVDNRRHDELDENISNELETTPITAMRIMGSKNTAFAVPLEKREERQWGGKALGPRHGARFSRSERLCSPCRRRRAYEYIL